MMRASRKAYCTVRWTEWFMGCLVFMLWLWRNIVENNMNRRSEQQCITCCAQIDSFSNSWTNFKGVNFGSSVLKMHSASLGALVTCALWFQVDHAAGRGLSYSSGAQVPVHHHPHVMVLDASALTHAPNTADVDCVVGYERSPVTVICHSQSAGSKSPR